MSLHACPEELYWYYIEERLSIYQKKASGQPKPWTKDPILQRYKFCNVYRQQDTGTAWLIDNFLIPHSEDAPHLLVFNICWYRMFNWWKTGAKLGWLTEWDAEVLKPKLHGMEKAFTGAYIIHSEPGMNKVESISDVCEELYAVAPQVVEVMGITNSLKATWNGLQAVRHVGPFMAYQMVLDMMYVPGLLDGAEDARTWTCTGPGALRGLRRLYPETMPSDSLWRMLALTEKAPLVLPDIPLTVHDVEFALCELDKYCRVRYEEGRPRSTYPGI